MGEKKVTIMVLNVVDLHCHKCYKKVKKVLCKFSEIRDQSYDEKQNQVVIKVVCCSPEKIRDKICCKGRGAIISIEIKEPEKPKPETKPPPVEKPKERTCSCGCGGRACSCGCGGRACSCGCGGRACSCGCGERLCYNGYGWRLVYDSYGGDSRWYCVTRPDYFIEENPSACTVM